MRASTPQSLRLIYCVQQQHQMPKGLGSPQKIFWKKKIGQGSLPDKTSFMTWKIKVLLKSSKKHYWNKCMEETKSTSYISEDWVRIKNC